LLVVFVVGLDDVAVRIVSRGVVLEDGAVVTGMLDALCAKSAGHPGHGNGIPVVATYLLVRVRVG